MKLIDTHCHLDSPHFRDNLDEIITQGTDAGIAAFITAAINPEGWRATQEIAARYREVEFALGIHPWYITSSNKSATPELVHAGERGAVAIGEIGLDTRVSSPDFAVQLPVFEEQLAIAREINLPVVIHCRGAFNELIASLKRVGILNAGGMIHSFTGSREIAEELVPLGIHFSLGGILTRRNSKKRVRMLQAIYPDHFLLETDSPDIPPVEALEKLNVPANILYNLRAAADILGVSVEDVAEKTTENAARLFNLQV